jgi:CHAT domain-containing protein
MMSCSREDRSARATFERANQKFLRGDLRQSQEDAERGYQAFIHSCPEWAWQFRILEAKAALWRGLYGDVLNIVKSVPTPSDRPDLAIPVLTFAGVAQLNTHNFSEAERSLGAATKLCDTSALASCGYLLQARGLLASEQAQSDSAEKLYLLTLSFARAHGDRFLESDALLNLGAESLTQGRFDTAIERSDAANQVATAIQARNLQLVTEGNIGWAYYRLGDLERALALFLRAEKTASDLGDVFDQENLLTNIGYIYMDERKFDQAEQSFQQALGLAQGIKAKADIYNVQRVLARLALQTGDLDQASNYADQALRSARESAKHLDELYPLLVQGQIAARRSNAEGAKRTFEAIEQDKICPVFLKWEAQHSLARLYEDGNRPDLADRQYRAALATFEAARADVRHEDLHLSFLTNGWRIYDDYVHFLVSRGKTNDALRWADHSRARTLSEGLGLLAKGAAGGPPPLNAPEIARRSQGLLLYYWLGERQSYLWAITTQKTSLFTLPPGAEIDAAVQRYRMALAGPVDVLTSGDNDGRWLYRTLVAPAQTVLPKDSTVLLVPDGSLNNLNFETLLVSEPKLHYWIEDATVASASSLRVLAATYGVEKKPARRLLLVGNSIAPNDKYPELLRAAAQMESVSSHFPDHDRRVLSREFATPAAYLDSHPEQFTHLHFVAHGTASRVSPLDSAIVLSRSGTDPDSFKLYARDIIRHPLQADLVAISACYGTGERSYAGEGLVGLSWAFLRAGAHNVIAALWEASDISTEKLMARFYEELDSGASPAAALRTAKLALLHGNELNSPFYWAPFQLYTQGRQATTSYDRNATARLEQPSPQQAEHSDKNRAAKPAAISRQTTTE